MRVRDLLGIGERRQRQLTWLMEVGLLGMFFVALVRGDTGTLVNTAVALLVTQLPPLLERDYNIPMDPALVLWITTAVFLHALGTLEFRPGALAPYQSIPWWDHLTHVLSSSVVAAVGYATARAIDEHSEAVYLPPRFTFAFVLLFVMAFGVLWEVLEFGVGGAAALLGSESVLTQYGLEDTMWDLVFDTVGAVVVAVWGTAYLTDVVGALTARLDARTSR